MLRIGIVVGSTRPGRRAAAVAEWVYSQAASQEDVVFEVVDIADHGLDRLDETAPALFGDYQHEHTRRWSRTVAALDGFVIVVPEYNHSFPGSLKTAIDFLYQEWRDKPVGFVSYGLDGGVRAVEQLRQVAAEVGLASVQAQVALTLGVDFPDAVVAAGQDKHDRLSRMLVQVVTWGTALQGVRAAA